ncbi:unnamed protein product [Merluccius merluccius]
MCGGRASLSLGAVQLKALAPMVLRRKVGMVRTPAVPALPRVTVPTSALCLSRDSATSTASPAFHFRPDLTWTPAGETFESLYSWATLLRLQGRPNHFLRNLLTLLSKSSMVEVKRDQRGRGRTLCRYIQALNANNHAPSS